MPILMATQKWNVGRSDLGTRSDFMFDKDVWEAILISVSVPALIVAVIGFSAYVSCKDWSE